MPDCLTLKTIEIPRKVIIKMARWNQKVLARDRLAESRNKDRKEPLKDSLVIEQMFQKYHPLKK